MMLAAIVLVMFNVTFWTLFEQAGSSLTLFADRNTDLELFGCSACRRRQTQHFNPIFDRAFRARMSWLWITLAKRGIGAPIPVKFGIALAGRRRRLPVPRVGRAVRGTRLQGRLVVAGLTYFLHSIAELCISPVGLSMITKLSIARIVGLMMGVWFLSISVAQYVAGCVAQVASVETVGGQVTNLQVSLHTYVGMFMTIGWVAIGRRACSCCSLSPAQVADARRQMMRAGGALSPHRSALSACAALGRKPKAAPADSDQRGSLSVDLRPLSGRADGYPPRHRFRRRGRRIDNGTVVFADGVVQAVGGPDLASPAGALEIDGTGKWVTPGIIDVHSHLGDYPSPGVDAQFRRQRSDCAGPARSLGRAQRLAAGSRASAAR